MSEAKISCPHCTQHIALDDAWAGQTINCPACQRPFVVPGAPPMAQVITPSAPGLRISGAAAAQPAAPPAGSAGPARPQPAPGTKISGLAIASLVLSLLGCFFITAIAGVICGHMARGRIRANRNLSGGGLALAGLIIGYLFIGMNVAYLIKRSPQIIEGVKRKQAQRAGGAIYNPGGGAPTRSADFNVRVSSRAEKPDGAVSGTVYGMPFTYTRSMLQRGVKCLEIDSREGTPNDQIIVISLNPKPGESLTDRTWHITAATQGLTPTVLVARMGVDPHGRSLPRGYQMDLTIGSASNGVVSGTITLKAAGAIPVDIKGNFNATVD